MNYQYAGARRKNKKKRKVWFSIWGREGGEEMKESRKTYYIVIWKEGESRR